MAAFTSLLLSLLVARAYSDTTQAPVNTDDEMKKWKDPEEHKEIVEALRKDIYKEYGTGLVDFKYAPESKDQNLVVEFAFIADKVTFVDERRQRFSVAGFQLMIWNDSRISWDPTDKNNIKSINLKPHKMWLPPVTASSGYMFRSSSPSPRATVTYQGETTYLAASTVGMDCPQMDYGNFPNDEHECTFGFWLDAFEIGGKQSVKLKSWKKTEDNVARFAMLPYLQLNADHWKNANSLTWEVTQANIELVHTQREGTLTHSAIEYKVRFRRKSSSFGLVFILPIVVSTVFLILMYSFPLGSRTRYWIALGAFLAFTQTYGQLYSFLPPASNSIPKIVKFYGMTLVIFLLSLIETALLEWVLKRLESSLCLPPPSILQSVFGKISKLFCYRSSGSESFVRFENQPTENGTVEAQQGTENAAKQATTKNPEWSDIIRVIDSMIFVVFSFFYILGLIVYVIF